MSDDQDFSVAAKVKLLRDGAQLPIAAVELDEEKEHLAGLWRGLVLEQSVTEQVDEGFHALAVRRD